jgi:uncharacterized protein
MRHLALDRASVRALDADGRLHVAVNNISKASVDPYYGYEIPGYDRLGLVADKVYHLLRDPDELAKAAGTFNNLPILAEHVPVSADNHMPDLVIGSTGTDAEFDGRFLRNSAVIWAQEAIDQIGAEEKRQWSCAYRYTPDMTPGEFNGLRYDGVMRNIAGNHVALVEQGRAGPEVVVGDEFPKGGVMLKSRRAVLLQGAFAASIGPRLAAGSKVDFAGALDSVTAASFTTGKAALAGKVVKLVAPHLAADEGLDVSDVVQIIDAVQGLPAGAVEDDDLNPPAPYEDPNDKPAAADADGDAMAKVMAFLKGKLSDEDYAACAEMSGGAPAAMDEDDDDMDEKKDDKPAMDAAIKKARADAVRDVLAIRAAEDDVFPHVGKLAVAMDSAADVYKYALETAGVDIAGVPPAAFKAMVGLLPRPGSERPKVAMDAGDGDDFRARFPHAATLIRS